MEKEELEKKQVKNKRLTYMQGLDQQITDNGRFKVTNAMTKAEMDFNIRDLNSYTTGKSDQLSSLVPGL